MAENKGFKIYQSSLDIMWDDKELSEIQKSTLDKIVKEFGNNVINMNLTDLGEKYRKSRDFMQDLINKASELKYMHKLGYRKYAVAEFFWWVPEPGINEQTAMSRYVARVSKRMMENGRRRAAGDPNWKHDEGYRDEEEAITGQEEHP